MAVTVNVNTLTHPVGRLHMVELISTCVAFSCVIHVDAWVGAMGNWCLFTWCFCFVVTFIVILIELFGCQARFPVSWNNFPVIYAVYAALFCLSSSIIYPTTHVQYMSQGNTKTHGIVATVFSCFAFVAYALEVKWTRGQSSNYLASVPGLLKVVETFVACMIFVFFSNPDIYQRHLALVWCVAVYSICFMLAAITILLNLGNCTNVLPLNFSTYLSGVAILSVLMYISALVLWPLYQFNNRLGGESRRQQDSYCAYRNPHSVCDWDRRLAVAILTGFNLIVYLADMVHSSQLKIRKG